MALPGSMGSNTFLTPNQITGVQGEEDDQYLKYCREIKDQEIKVMKMPEYKDMDLLKGSLQ